MASQQVAGTSQNVTVDNSEADYTFTVAATNKAGTSGTSAAVRRHPGRRQTRAWSAAEPLRTPGNSGRLKVTFYAADRGPAQRLAGLARSATAGPRRTARARSTPRGGTITGLPNGKNVTINIIAVSTKNNVSGDAKAIGSAEPLWPAGAPQPHRGTSSKGDGQVHWTWTQPNEAAGR